MKRLFALILSISLLFCILLPTIAFAASGDTIVYVTRTGECYHRDGCSYLKSKIEKTLSDAVSAGYRPCSRCHPPLLDDSGTVDTRSYTPTYGASAYGGSSRSRTYKATVSTPAVKSENHIETVFQRSAYVLCLLIGIAGLYYFRKAIKNKPEPVVIINEAEPVMEEPAPPPYKPPPETPYPAVVSTQIQGQTKPNSYVPYLKTNQQLFFIDKRNGAVSSVRIDRLSESTFSFMLHGRKYTVQKSALGVVFFTSFQEAKTHAPRRLQ